MLRVRCDCGVEKDTGKQELLRGQAKSCGCLARESSRRRSRRHGRSGTKVYNAWQSMISRCQNPKEPSFPHYGGRGIVVCDRWQSLEAFCADMGEPPTPGHTLGRIDNDGPYSPENCRWETRAQQSNNTRQTIWLEIGGVRRAVGAWARVPQCPVSARVIRSRLQAGWEPSRAVFEPRGHNGPGEDHYRAKLTAAQAIEIRRRAAAGEPPRDLAAEFGVSDWTVRQIASGMIWKGV